MEASYVTISDLFEAASLKPCRRPVAWDKPVPESRPGVYVVVHDGEVRTDGQSILYVGRTTSSLRKRINQFYKHRYGDTSPHRGGQEVLRFKPNLLVYWAATDDPAGAEHLLIERFRVVAGGLPFANRLKASRLSQPSIVSAQGNL